MLERGSIESGYLCRFLGTLILGLLSPKGTLAQVPEVEVLATHTEVPLTGFTTLRVELDNSANFVALTDFSLLLFPEGFLSTSLVTNTCGGTVQGLQPGGFWIEDGSLPAGETCLIEQEHRAESTGQRVYSVQYVRGADGWPEASLEVSVFQPPYPSGLAPSALSGGEIELKYSVNNTLFETRAATEVTTSHLVPSQVLGGFGELPLEPCGPSSQLELVGDSTLVLSGAEVGAEERCFYSVRLVTPLGTPVGAYDSSITDSTALVAGQTVELYPWDVGFYIGHVALEASFARAEVLPGQTIDLNLEIWNAVQDTEELSFAMDLAPIEGLEVESVREVGEGCGVSWTVEAGILEVGLGTVPKTSSGGQVPGLVPEPACRLAVALRIPLSTPEGNYQFATNRPSYRVAAGVATAEAGSEASASLFVRGALTAVPVMSGVGPWLLTLLLAGLGTLLLARPRL